ncbi:MAG: hypothetical protein ACLP00_15990 [Terracidiphilus sp.]
MKIFGWIQVVLGLLAIGSGAMVLRGLLRVALSGHRVVRFLECSLIASLVCLLPLTPHLLPIQGICMLSVYCAAVAVLAWRKFHLAGPWRAIFAFSIVAVLYLDVVSVSIQLFNHSPLFAMAVTESDSHFEIAQLFLASAFVVLGVLSVRHLQQTH